MEKAYCPYCGKEIAVRGQEHCPHCGADIIDIWKLLNSNLQPPSPVHPAPSRPKSMDWFGPAVIIGLGLVLFMLLLLGMVYGLPWLASLITWLFPGEVPLLETVAFISSQLAGL